MHDAWGKIRASASRNHAVELAVAEWRDGVCGDVV